MTTALEAAEEGVRVALDELARVRAALGLATGRRYDHTRFGSTANRSAYCIGASAGCGAKHSQCPKTYHDRPCTCDCHDAKYGAFPR